MVGWVEGREGVVLGVERVLGWGEEGEEWIFSIKRTRVISSGVVMPCVRR